MKLCGLVCIYQTTWSHVICYLSAKLHDITWFHIHLPNYMKSCSFVFINQTTRRHKSNDRNFNVGKTILKPAIPTKKIVGIIAFGYCYTAELQGGGSKLGAID